MGRFRKVRVVERNVKEDLDGEDGEEGCVLLFLEVLYRRIIRARRRRVPRETPTPIPAFAPVERPLE